jgi:hypothetical protein
LRHGLGIHKGACLDLIQPSVRECVDHPQLLGRGQDMGLDLQAVARSDFDDFYSLRQIQHFSFPQVFRRALTICSMRQLLA